MVQRIFFFGSSVKMLVVCVCVRFFVLPCHYRGERFLVEPETKKNGDFSVTKIDLKIVLSCCVLRNHVVCRVYFSYVYVVDWYGINV